MMVEEIANKVLKEPSLCSTGFCVQMDFMFNWKMSISPRSSNRNVFFLQVFSNFSQVAASEYYFQLYAFVSYGFEMFILLFASLYDLICVILLLENDDSKGFWRKWKMVLEKSDKSSNKGGKFLTYP